MIQRWGCCAIKDYWQQGASVLVVRSAARSCPLADARSVQSGTWGR